MCKCLKRVLKNFTLRSDLFAANAALRHKGESAYETLFGGILSILIVVGFAVIFFQSFIKVINKVDITSTVDIETDTYNTHIVDSLQLAIGVSDLDFSSSQRYFEIVLYHQSRPLGQNGTVTQIELETCNISNWENVGTNFDKLFEVYGLDTMLCTKEGEDISISGFAGSDVWEFLEIKVKKCVNQTDKSWTCYSQTDIDSYMSTYLNSNDYFEANIYFVDTVITPSQATATQKVIEDQIFLSFSTDIGSRGKIKIGDYNITTDESIWPVENETEEFGHYISSYSTHTTDIYLNHYVKVTIEKDQTVYVVERVYDKLDDMLSYAGGLFSLLFTFIFFFLGSYSQIKYEIAVAESAFTLDETGRKIRDKDFGFFTYLKYSIYDWLDTLGCTLKWDSMETIHKAREEATQQMDIRLLVRKMQRFEKITQVLLSERNMICAQLTGSPTLQKIKKMRKITQYYDKVIRDPQNYQDCKGSGKIVPASSPINVQVVLQDSKSPNDPLSEELQFEQTSDFDSDDEQIERQIADEYFNLNNSAVSQHPTFAVKILEEVPQLMKKRMKIIKERNQLERSANKESAQLSQISMQNSQSNPIRVKAAHTIIK